MPVIGGNTTIAPNIRRLTLASGLTILQARNQGLHLSDTFPDTEAGLAEAEAWVAAGGVSTAPHVVTPVEEMLRQQRPAGKKGDPRGDGTKTPRGAVKGHAYLMADEHDRVKIGAAEGADYEVLGRRADLQVGNADDLTILAIIPSDDVYALEAALKAHYRSARVRGEWFRRDAVEPFFGTEGLA